jgi:23S rRNA (cytosine1962-C5)-methyltransferase
LPFYGRHPWVRDSAIARIEPVLAAPAGVDANDPSRYDGAMVDLLNDKGRFIARGFFNSRSHIRVRLYSWNEAETLDAAFFRRRIESAVALRQHLGYEGSPTAREHTATRLVFSEADNFSGLIVDRYGEYRVLQATSLAVAERLETIVPILFEVLRPRGAVLRAEKASSKWEGFELEDGHIWGERPSGPLTIEENGLKFLVDLCEGQKTGFYLDQRENRVAAAKYLGGRRVLDMFCYTGGFSLAAAKLGGAADVLGIDTSKRAVTAARENASLNGLTNVRFDEGDGFGTLDALATEGRKFGGIILDPPKFAPSRSRVDQALQAYHRINRAAAELLEPGGILVTCSCSGSVTREDFLLMLSGVAQKAGRDIQILETRGAAADHPVAATCLETEYLKCIIARVV